MSYSCSDFVDDILNELRIKVPVSKQDNPLAQARLAIAKIRSIPQLRPSDIRRVSASTHNADITVGELVKLRTCLNTLELLGPRGRRIAVIYDPRYKFKAHGLEVSGNYKARGEVIINVSIVLT